MIPFRRNNIFSQVVCTDFPGLQAVGPGYCRDDMDNGEAVSFLFSRSDTAPHHLIALIFACASALDAGRR